MVGIGCGGNHNLALTEKNEVYSWGYGDMLALGHGEEKDEVLPKKLNFSKAKIKNITITQVGLTNRIAPLWRPAVQLYGVVCLCFFLLQVAGGGQHSAIIGQVTTA